MSYPFADDHNAFQSLVFDHFRNLKNETERWSKLRADLEQELASKIDLVTDQQRIIQALEGQLAEARRINAQLQEMETVKQAKILRPSDNRSLANKENVATNILQSLKDISPPRRAAKLCPATIDATSESEKTTLGKSTANIAVETEPWDPDRRDKLLVQKYELAIKERDTYKNAYEKLMEKYAGNKQIWQNWTEEFQKEKKTKRRGAHLASSRKGTPTPAGRLASPPFISPMKSSPYKDMEPHIPVRKGGLFSELKPPVPVRASSFSGVFGSDNDADDLRKSAPPIAQDSSPPKPSAPTEMPDTDPTSPPSPEMEPAAVSENDDVHPPTSDAEDPREGSLTPKPSRRAARGSSSHANPSPATRKRYSDGTQASPVVIKSEPQSSSSEGVGYYIFDEESLDLDDVDQPEPKKRRKSGRGLAKEKHGTPVREAPGFRAPLATLEHTNDELPPPRDPSEALARSLGKRKGNTRETTPDGPASVSVKAAAPDSPATRKSTRTPRTTRRRNAVSPRKAASIKNSATTTKASTRKRRSDKYNVTASVLGDGTDGAGSIVKRTGPPDVDTPVVLDNILATPAPKNPTLHNLSRGEAATVTEHSFSAPPKRRAPWGGDGFDIDNSASATTPHPRTRSGATRQAQTDPARDGKNSADIPVIAFEQSPTTNAIATDEPVKTALPLPDRPLSISDFRINPAMNQGLDYAFKETVRRKEDKRCLPSCTKPCCRDLGKFVGAAGLPKLPKGPRWRDTDSSQEPPMDEDEKSLRELEGEFLERFGRHKDTFGGLGRRPSPPGFWRSDFPTTQEQEKDREEADRLDQIRLEQLRMEAEKGSNGRYIYKGR